MTERSGAFVVRPVRSADLGSLLELAGLASFGLTTLPKDEQLLARRIRDSLHGFERIEYAEPRGEAYLFVLEEAASGRVIGTSGVVSKVGGFQPFYAYRVQSEVHESKRLGVRKVVDTLHLVMEHDGPCEIGSLFLHPQYRRGSGGRALSLARFLFMAAFPALFDPSVIAEIRGVVDDQGRSPFWDALGQHFFDMEFPKADLLSIIDTRFIAELMPRHPIYVPMLPPEARAAIGRPHPDSAAAKRILEGEGFRFLDMVDIFEAGPIIGCDRDRIRAVAEAVSRPVLRLLDEVEAPPSHVVTNTRRDFRACAAYLRCEPEGVSLARSAADALGVGIGDPVRCTVLRREAAP